jgi:hypothetical protein
MLQVTLLHSALLKRTAQVRSMQEGPLVSGEVCFDALAAAEQTFRLRPEADVGQGRSTIGKGGSSGVSTRPPEADVPSGWLLMCADDPFRTFLRVRAGKLIVPPFSEAGGRIPFCLHFRVHSGDLLARATRPGGARFRPRRDARAVAREVRAARCAAPIQMSVVAVVANRPRLASFTREPRPGHGWPVWREARSRIRRPRQREPGALIARSLQRCPPLRYYVPRYRAGPGEKTAEGCGKWRSGFNVGWWVLSASSAS